jgi:hypothetical protein
MPMPKFLEDYLNNLNAVQADLVHEWVDESEDALQEIIDVVAPKHIHDPILLNFVSPSRKKKKEN